MRTVCMCGVVKLYGWEYKIIWIDDVAYILLPHAYMHTIHTAHTSLYIALCSLGLCVADACIVCMEWPCQCMRRNIIVRCYMCMLSLFIVLSAFALSLCSTPLSLSLYRTIASLVFALFLSFLVFCIPSYVLYNVQRCRRIQSLCRVFAADIVCVVHTKDRTHSQHTKKIQGALRSVRVRNKTCIR